MKVAIVINTAWNIFNFRKGIVQELLANGHEVVAIAPTDDYVSRLESWGCQFHHLSIAGSGINPWRDFLLFLRFLRLVHSIQPDVMLTYTIKPNIYGSLIRRLLKTRIICNVSGLGTVFMRKGMVSSVAIALYRRSVKHADWVFFQNDEDQALFTSRVPISEESMSLLNGSGIDLTAFHPRPSEEYTAPVFLMIGRLISEKGVYEFVDAARRVKQQFPNVRFQLLGSRDEKDPRSVSSNELKAWQEEGLLEYLGTTDDVREPISNADVVVLPSYREGTPRTLLEAGAMGKPLLATDVPGCRHVVMDGQNGFLCSAKSGNALAVIMEKYLRLPFDEQRKMATTSRSIIEQKFDERLVVKSYIDVINKLVQRRN